ncbi:GNAT family N-acetyltransferase [Sinomicrobium weinanense]|uniref:GNAT family N-acetyltransferase n=1 Tax=Sinomicrobium weinanense TaxID=2842200 RepID=UPI001FFDA095|nr:GNAT family N-acetyltransferase [Sinomicrobium weinanense]
MDIVIANKSHIKHATVICDTIEESAKVRGTGIAKRTPEYIISKIENGNAVIAVDGDKFAGFCYIEAWGHGKFVANSGLIVHPDYRKIGLAKKIKKTTFEYSRTKYPDAKIFGITTGLAVMKINYELGYKPVTFSELTDDPTFWKGCQTCKNYDILQRTQQKMCLCTGMMYDPKEKENKKQKHPYNSKVLQRLKNIKQALLLKKKKPAKNSIIPLEEGYISLKKVMAKFKGK